MTRLESSILVFSITLCWSVSYVFIKDLPPELSSYAYLTFTCGISAVLMTMVFWKKLLKVRISTLVSAFICSIVLTLTLLFDKLGISTLQPSTASVLSASSILIVPVIMIFIGRYPTINNMAGALVIMLGILTTVGFAISMIFSVGSIFMLLSALMMSFYIIIVDKVSKEEDPMLLTILQMWFSAFIGFVIWFIEEPRTFFSIEYTNRMLSSIFILAFFTKAYVYMALMYSQKYSNPINVTIIASTEPVGTLILAVLIPSAENRESLTVFSVMGAVLIMIGAVISGTSFLSGIKGIIKKETEK